MCERISSLLIGMPCCAFPSFSICLFERPMVVVVTACPLQTSSVAFISQQEFAISDDLPDFQSLSFRFPHTLLAAVPACSPPRHISSSCPDVAWGATARSSRVSITLWVTNGGIGPNTSDRVKRSYSRGAVPASETEDGGMWPPPAGTEFTTSPLYS